MAVKRKKQKRLESKLSWERAVKIKCCYCQSKNTCQFRQRKEADENRGIITYCTLTPNPKKEKAAGPKNFFEAMFASDEQKKIYNQRKKENKKHIKKKRTE